MILSILAAAAVALAVRCGGDGGGGSGRVAVGLELAASGLSFPLFVASPPGDRERLFVVERAGRIRIVRDGAVVEPPFLDASGQIASGGERGLLGLAFHPAYASNGRFFVNFTNSDGDTRIVEYTVSADPDRADAGSARVLLAVDQPFANHNGGMLAFGPDEFLYVGLGDGGSGGDPQGNGQDTGVLLGKILRIDVDRGDPYAIPPDNPFAAMPGARGEIWAYGLRNPWRFSFDRANGRLYIADVGQEEREEIDVEPAASGGRNYGWNVMEGSRCFEEPGCDRSGLTLPVLEYGHDEGCSVTGGYVYRGEAIPELQGHYFYGDFCEGFVRSFRFSGGEAEDRRSWPELVPGGPITSFGEDDAGELYVVVSSGSVFRIVPE